MKAVIQRVNKAQVSVDGQVVGSCAHGWFVLLGVGEGDSSEDVDYLVQKILGLRGFSDAQGKMNLDLKEIQGEMLVISQFTLYGDTRKGRRPSFVGAASPALAQSLYSEFISKIRSNGITVGCGRFGAHMQIQAECDGPVTLSLESPKP